MTGDTRITVRLGPGQLERLDALAAAAGISRSLALRRLVDDADPAPPNRGHLDRDDLIALLEERALAGSAPAARELLRRRDGEEQLARVRQLTTDNHRPPEAEAVGDAAGRSGRKSSSRRRWPRPSA